MSFLGHIEIICVNTTLLCLTAFSPVP
jgi:hypothetical protein